MTTSLDQIAQVIDFQKHLKEKINERKPTQPARHDKAVDIKHKDRGADGDNERG
jgi:hypothetical protein